MHKIFYEAFYHGNGNKSIPIDKSAIDVLRDLVLFVHLKNVKNTIGGVLLLEWRLLAYNFTKINTPAWLFFTFFKLCKWYQIMQRITNDLTLTRLGNPNKT